MRKSVFALLFLTAGCASPAPQFLGATRHDVTLSGIRFVVFQKGETAEVVRLGYLVRAERAQVPALMLRAAEMTTGCAVVPGSEVTGLPGDTGEMRLRLRCPAT
ncbi:MAG: hypothetical protein Q8O82_15550 [Pseudorhodobacter sp.]|nr:hypothetical protein [Pseudorhodobacter sp.]